MLCDVVFIACFCIHAFLKTLVYTWVSLDVKYREVCANKRPIYY